MALIFAGASTRGLAAQAPLDYLGTHFGGARVPVLAEGAWFGGSFMLLTQLDGRWDRRAGFINYDSLETTVGYNYLTGGRQWVQTDVFVPGASATIAASVHLGFTKDSLVVAGVQTSLHDFLQIPHVFRPRVDDGDLHLGVDVEALWWTPSQLFAVGPHASLGTLHREIGASALGRFPVWNVLLVPAVTVARVGSSGVRPSLVADRIDKGYWSGRLTVEWPAIMGFSVVWSDGIFVDERECLMSVYLDARVDSNNRIRFEFVNDLLNDKDRGPTGGGRLVWLTTF